MPNATTTSKPSSGPPTRWTTMQSLLFPSEWPPTASTTWVRYAFAYGTNPTTLMDGAYVTQPLTRTIVQRDGSNGEATTLSTVLEEAGIQGVKPLDAESRMVLSKGPQVQAQCLQWQSLPDEAASAEAREYYRLWSKLHGAFTRLIRPNHAMFFEWIDGEK